uniref:Reverse transcriptase domain-containing protein n=1 Tax=Tanacetum cinerariifolium TaxID=118510 RepID=A0A6L2JLN5_TANCI|nr:reverse transcriptase domain-containing protein [Tanacetum cinerariifolium]
MFLEKYFPPSMVTKLRNEITNFHQRPDESLFEAWERYKLSIDRCPNHNMLPVTQIDTFYNGLTLRHRDTINAVAGGTFMKRPLKVEMAEINKNLMRVLQVNQQVKEVTSNCENYGGPHSFFNCPTTVGNTQNVYAAGAYQGIKENIILKGTTKEGTNSSRELTKIPQPQVVTTNEFTNFMKPNDAILKNMQTNMTSLTNSNLELKNMFGQFMKMNTASSSGSRTLPGNTITNPNEDLKGIITRSRTAYQGPTIPTTSSSPVVERETKATKDIVHPTNNGSTEDVQPPVVPTESPILNSEPINSPIIEPVAYPNKLPLPDLSFTCMTLELVDRSISHPVGVAEDVFVKVGTFHFPADFVVVDFNADPRVPLILGRYFLKTRRALIDVFEANYNDMMANRIDVIDMACEEYSQEVLDFSDVIVSGNPTPYYDPIVSTTSLTLTPFGNSGFLFEEVDAFLVLEDDPTSSEFDQSYVDTKGEIIFLEAFLNDDPSLPPPNQGNYLPEVRKELKICEAKSDKSSIDEPPEVELKDLPPHLEYIFLESNDKLPVIIAKKLSVEEKITLITVLKSHKRAIAWKLSDIKGIDPEFCTHKILMEEDFKPVVQHQRRVNPKIHDVIKQEAFKLFDAGLIYPISDSPWMLKRCEDTNLCLNWEKSHFMVKEGIVIGHKISKNGIKVDKAKVDVIAKLPYPTTVKGIRSFLGHAGFYRRFIKEFSKIARPMTRLLKKDTSFLFSKECVEAFQTLKRKLTEAPILIAPDWDMPFGLIWMLATLLLVQSWGNVKKNILGQYTMPVRPWSRQNQITPPHKRKC